MALFSLIKTRGTKGKKIGTLSAGDINNLDVFTRVHRIFAGGSFINTKFQSGIRQGLGQSRLVELLA